MRNKINYIFLFLIPLLGWGQNQSETLSLKEAVAYGLENNTNIISANLDVQKAYKEKWNTTAMGLPQVDASVNYQNFIEQPVSLIPAQFFGGKEGEFAEVQFGQPQNMAAGINLRQLLFDGSYLVGLRASKVYLEISKNLLDKTVIEVRKNIVNSYAAVLLVQANIEFLQKNKQNLEQNLEELTALWKNGFEEEESVEQLRLTLSGINTQLNYAENIQQISLDLLKLLLGFPPEKNLVLTDSLEALTQDHLFFEKEALDGTDNIDIKIAQNNLDSEALLLDLQRSKALPRLAAFINGNYTGFGQNFEFLNRNQKWFGSSLFGVNLEIPLFSSLGRSALTQKSKISVEQAEINLDAVKDRIQIEIRAAQNDHELAVKSYFTAKDNLALADRIEQKNKTKFFEGLATSFELRQAQLQLYNAQNNYVKAIQTLIDKKINLESLLNTSAVK